MGTLCGGVDFLSTPSGVCSCGARRVVRRGRVWEMFRASERDLLLATVPKVGKSTGRNLRFLHFRTRYSACRSRGVYHAFAGEFPFRFVKRIVSAPAPLPLADAEKKSLRLSGSGVSLQVNSLVPSSEGGFGGCTSTDQADRVVHPYGGSIELLPFIGRADVGIAPYERFIVPLAFSGRRGEGTLEMVIKPLR